MFNSLLWLIVCVDKLLFCTFDLVWILPLFVPEKAWLPFDWPQLSYQRQKMLVTLLVTFPLTVLTISQEYSGKRGIVRQSRSRHVGELPNLFKCEVRSPSSLLSKSFLNAICRAQPRAGCKCIWERLVWNPLQASTVEHSWITLAHDSYPSSIGLSRDMWHCRRRRL